MLLRYSWAALALLLVTGCGKDKTTNPKDPPPGISGGQILFSSTRIPGVSTDEIFRMNADGSGVTRLTFTTNTQNENPAWSPDGARIAFDRVAIGSGSRYVWVMNADGSGAAPINTGSIEGRDPDWSPDGARIVFLGSSTADSLYTVKADGTDLRVIPNSAGGMNPAWSPDGSKIAFRFGVLDICVIAPDGTGFVDLTNSPAGVQNGSPAWSPDGTRIAFWSTRDGGTDIYTMKTDGTDVRRLTSTGYNVHPAWSPDGTRIAFQTTRDGNAEIYVMSADGAGQTNLTLDGANDYQPD